MNKDALLNEWSETAAQLRILRDKESELRKQLIVAFSQKANEEELPKGTERVALGFGKELKIGHKVNDTVNPVLADEVVNELKKKKLLSAEMAEKVWRRKPEPNASFIKNLPENVQKIISKAITSKPGTPSVEIVDAK